VQPGVPGLPPFGEEGVAEARSIGAACGGVRVWSLYVPNGRVVDDPHYHYKLHWLAVLRDYAEKLLVNEPHAQVALCGDFNIAPADLDVHDPEAWRGQVLCSDAERAAFTRLLGWGLGDAFRTLHPDLVAYSWWDYRQLGFPKNRGLRIDHALLTRPLLERCREARVDRDERKGKLPSDHAPVLIELA